MPIRDQEKETHPSVPDLRRLSYGIMTPFACEGKVTLKEPVVIQFADKTNIKVVPSRSAYDQEKEMQALIDHCQPAPFGRGQQTMFNRTVRDARQLKADSFSLLNFDPQATGILEEVRQKLIPQDPNPLSAELDKLNVYPSGGHFKSHKDTPRGPDMLGTLVVILPCQFVQGALTVSHQGYTQIFEWDKDIRRDNSPTILRWAAFFGDVDHEIKEVFSGIRVSLSYILRRQSSGPELPTIVPAELKETEEKLRQKLLEVKSDTQLFTSQQSELAFHCSHLYTNKQFPKLDSGHFLDAKTIATKLKGRDQTISLAALKAGYRVRLQPYMVEYCADSTWELRHFPKRRLAAKVDNEKIEKTLSAKEIKDDEKTAVTWVDPQPGFNFTPQKPKIIRSDQEDNDSIQPAVQHMRQANWSATGYFGNEACITEFYIYSALHISPDPEFSPDKTESLEKNLEKSKTTVKSPRKTAKKKETQDAASSSHSETRPKRTARKKMPVLKEESEEEEEDDEEEEDSKPGSAKKRKAAKISKA